MSPQLRTIGNSDLKIFPLALGGNVFGWTADQITSETVLDGFVAEGGNLIDTSDSYSFWAPGNVGGESENIIGQWMRARKNRDQVTIATKVSQHPEFTGLAPNTIRTGLDESLRRLQIEEVDLYYAHFDDADTPLEDSIATFSELIDSGKIRYLGISNYSAERLQEWLSISERGGYHMPVALQPQYSLMERGIEQTTLPIAQKYSLGVLPYYALARGFLTGKYREDAPKVDSPRSEIASGYLDERGKRVLAALEEIATNYSTEMGSVAIAWLAAQQGVVAPIASARTIEQLPTLLNGAKLELTPAEVAHLTTASGE